MTDIPTPLTDSVAFYPGSDYVHLKHSPLGPNVRADFARTLERRLIVTQEKLEKAEHAANAATLGLWSEWELERAKYKAMETAGIFKDANAELLQDTIKKNIELQKRVRELEKK